MHPLRHQVFRVFFVAQILSLFGIGLLTVALALTAYRVAGAAAAGMVLGLILTLKMVAYVGLAPIAEAVLSAAPPRRTLIVLDVLRAALLLPMAFATNTWQIAVLAFAFFAASAAFTPLYQATVPVILDDKAVYARALALSRLASSAEAIASPALAGMMLALVDGRALFPLAALCFAGSVVALLLVRLDRPIELPEKAPFLKRASRGIWIELMTPRLRGLLVVNLGLSLGLSWVLVNTVVFAGLRLDDPELSYTRLMLGYGAGAAGAALTVPRLVEALGERRVILAGGLLFAALSPAILIPMTLPAFVALWAGFGVAATMVLTPGGLVLTRSARSRDWPALFAAQFSLSHAAWLCAYPLAGWAGAALGPEGALLALGAAALAVTLLGAWIWPRVDVLEREHSHQELDPGDPHLTEFGARGPTNLHSHAFHIDEKHPRWSM